MGERIHTPKKLINLLRGWPSPSVLPVEALKAATARVLSDPAVFVPGLQYAPDPGFYPLREALAAWLSRFYGGVSEPERICITGGASQSIANILASFTDPFVTRAVWMAAPCYFLACPIFEDAGFGGRMRAAPEDEHGLDVDALEERLRRFDEAWERECPTVCISRFFFFLAPFPPSTHYIEHPTRWTYQTDSTAPITSAKPPKS